MSLRNNLDLGADLSTSELHESIHIATMTRDVEKMPKGLETLIGPLFEESTPQGALRFYIERGGNVVENE